jgi:hypothetical protein
MIVLREIQRRNGFDANSYPLPQLKTDICDSGTDESREICPAFRDFEINGRASQWAK